MSGLFECLYCRMIYGKTNHQRLVEIDPRTIVHTREGDMWQCPHCNKVQAVGSTCRKVSR